MEDLEKLDSLDDLKGLKVMCDKYCVKKYGTKESLKTKLRKAINQAISESSVDNSVTGGSNESIEDDVFEEEDGVFEEEEDFTTDWLVKDLKSACEKRNISKSKFSLFLKYNKIKSSLT